MSKLRWVALALSLTSLAALASEAAEASPLRSRQISAAEGGGLADEIWEWMTRIVSDPGAPAELFPTLGAAGCGMDPNGGDCEIPAPGLAPDGD